MQPGWPAGQPICVCTRNPQVLRKHRIRHRSTVTNTVFKTVLPYGPDVP